MFSSAKRFNTSSSDKHRVSRPTASPLSHHICTTSATLGGGPLVYHQLLANHNQARSAYWEVQRHHQRQQHYWHCQEVDEEDDTPPMDRGDRDNAFSRSTASISSVDREGSATSQSVFFPAAASACTSSPRPTCAHTHNTRTPHGFGATMQQQPTVNNPRGSVSRSRANRRSGIASSTPPRTITQSSAATTTSSSSISQARDRVVTLRKTVTKNGPLRGDHGVLSSKQITSSITTWKSTTRIKYVEIAESNSVAKDDDEHDNSLFFDEKHHSDDHSDSPISPCLSSGEESSGEFASNVSAEPSSSRRYHRKRSLSSILKEIVEYEAASSPVSFPAKHPRHGSSQSSELVIATSSVLPQRKIATNPRCRRSNGHNSETVSTHSQLMSSVLPAPLPSHLMPQPVQFNNPVHCIPLIPRYVPSRDQDPSYLCHQGPIGIFPTGDTYFQSQSKEIQTSPSVVSSDHDQLNDSGSTVASSVFGVQPSNNLDRPSSHRRQKTKRRSSGSRQFLESICRTAKRTFGSLRRAMSSDGLNTSSVTAPSSFGEECPPPSQHRFPAGLADSDFMSCTRGGTTGNFFPHEKKRRPATAADFVRLQGINKRHSTILLDKPVAGVTASDCTKSPPVARSASALAVVGRSRLVELHSDGSKTVKLVRPETSPFGFFVAKGDQGLYVSRMAVNCAHLNGIVSVGDEILEIEGLSCRQMNLEEVHNAIGRRRNVTFRIRTCRIY